MGNKKSEEIRNLVEATNMLAGLHVQSFDSYMKLTNNNVELSLKLAKDYISAILSMSANQNGDSQKNQLF